MIRKISHIAFATRSIAVFLDFYKTLGLEMETMEVVEEQGVKIAMLRVGDVHIELIEPLGKDSPVGRFLEKRGEGFHHISFEVDDIKSEIKRLKEKDVRLLSDKPQRGIQKSRIAFIHPASTGGVLMELCQKETQD